jgi:DNA-binding CsgD family transcriptional regulator
LSAGDLTGIEHLVAGEIRLGRSNQEIADALGMSPKTVEWNLTKIYRKIGVRSRTQLVLKLTEFDQKGGRE